MCFVLKSFFHTQVFFCSFFTCLPHNRKKKKVKRSFSLNITESYSETMCTFFYFKIIQLFRVTCLLKPFEWLVKWDFSEVLKRIMYTCCETNTATNRSLRSKYIFEWGVVLHYIFSCIPSVVYRFSSSSLSSRRRRALYTCWFSFYIHMKFE